MIPQKTSCSKCGSEILALHWICPSCYQLISTDTQHVALYTWNHANTIRCFDPVMGSRLLSTHVVLESNTAVVFTNLDLTWLSQVKPLEIIPTVFDPEPNLEPSPVFIQKNTALFRVSNKQSLQLIFKISPTQATYIAMPWVFEKSQEWAGLIPWTKVTRWLFVSLLNASQKKDYYFGFGAFTSLADIENCLANATKQTG